MTFLDLLILRGIPFRRRNEPGEIWLACPFCADSRFRLGLNWRRNVGNCFNCGWKSRKAIQGLLYLWKLRIDVQQFGLAEPEETDKQIFLRLPEDYIPLWNIRISDGPPYSTPLSYWKNRGFTTSQARRHRIGATFQGRYAYRIIMPVFWQKTIEMLVCRTFADREPKYLNSEGPKTIWNLKKAKAGQKLILVEGILKGLALERLVDRNLYHCASPLGHSITEQQMERIAAAGFREIMVYPDPDRPGLEGSLAQADLLSDFGFKVQLPNVIPQQQIDEDSPDRVRGILASFCTPDLRLQARYWKEAMK